MLSWLKKEEISLIVKEWQTLVLAAFFFIGGYIFPFPLAFFIISYLLCGTSVIKKSFHNLSRGEIFDENLLMTIASVGAFCIGESPEGAAVMLFYQIGERLQEQAAEKSRNRIVKLMDLRPETARVLNGSAETEIPPEQVTVGQIIRIRPGERIALDGTVIRGQGLLDVSALTGEARPQPVTVSSRVLAGSISADTSLEIRVEKDYHHSTLSQIIELAEHAATKKSKSEKFITRFAHIYTPIVVGIAFLLAIFPPLLVSSASFHDWIYRALIFLVISCPCALVLSVPLGFFGGIGGAARYGILLKGSTYIEQLTKLNTLVFDKTGTLTQGVFEVLSVHPQPSVTKEYLLETAAALETNSNHPIAAAVLRAYGKKPPVITDQLCERAGEGILADNKTAVGNTRLMEQLGITNLPTVEGTCVHVAKNNTYQGYILLGDRLKPTAKEGINELKKQIKRLVILSGDNESSVSKTALETGISEAYGNLLPSDKIKHLEQILSQTPSEKVTAFAGDGINDAPSLMRADIGIAMGALGSDIAIEAADVVLMTDDLKKISTAIRLSNKTMRIIKQNVWLALGVKCAVLLLGIFGLANMWGAVFADVGVSLLAVSNSLRALYYKE